MERMPSQSLVVEWTSILKQHQKVISATPARKRDFTIKQTSQRRCSEGCVSLGRRRSGYIQFGWGADQSIEPPTQQCYLVCLSSFSVASLQLRCLGMRTLRLVTLLRILKTEKIQWISGATVWTFSFSRWRDSNTGEKEGWQPCWLLWQDLWWV